MSAMGASRVRESCIGLEEVWRRRAAVVEGGELLLERLRFIVTAF